MSLTIADLDRFIDRLKEECANPHFWFFEVSPYALGRIQHLERIHRMYRIYPSPRHKIRKCHMRKLVERRRRYRQHIARVEQAEEARKKVA